MGMTCTLRRVNETDLRRLREAPEQVLTFIHGEPVPLETVREPGLTGFIMRLLGVTTQRVSPTAAVDESLDQPINDDELDLDKAWDRLHYLLTGTADEGQEPACFLVAGGEEIGNEDDGPARVLRPDQVSQFATFLAELSDEELARRYDPTRMTAVGIYSKRWPPGEEEFEILLEAFKDLREFVTETSAGGDSLIVSII